MWSVTLDKWPQSASNLPVSTVSPRDHCERLCEVAVWLRWGGVGFSWRLATECQLWNSRNGSWVGVLSRESTAFFIAQWLSWRGHACLCVRVSVCARARVCEYKVCWSRRSVNWVCEHFLTEPKLLEVLCTLLAIPAGWNTHHHHYIIHITVCLK